MSLNSLKALPLEIPLKSQKQDQYVTHTATPKAICVTSQNTVMCYKNKQVCKLIEAAL